MNTTEQHKDTILPELFPDGRYWLPTRFPNKPWVSYPTMEAAQVNERIGRKYHTSEEQSDIRQPDRDRPRTEQTGKNGQKLPA